MDASNYESRASRQRVVTKLFWIRCTSHFCTSVLGRDLLYKPDSKEVTQITGSLGSADIRLLLAINQGNSELLWVGTNRGLYTGNLDEWEALSELENRQMTALVWIVTTAVSGSELIEGPFTSDRDNSWKVVNEFNIQNSGLKSGECPCY